MIKKYTTKKTVDELTEYMDTLVRYVFYKLNKAYDKHDTIYYPAYYLYRPNISELEDYNHLDQGYRNVSIILRKVTNNATMIIVKLEGIDENDWRYPLLSSVYHKAVVTIDRSLDKFSTNEEGN